MKIFSTRMHGVLDYLSVSSLLLLPRVMHWSPRVTTVVTGSALSTLGASLLTRYELGVFKVLPMRAHLTLDALNGMLFCAAPLLFPDEDNAVKGALVGVGLFELFAAFTTETEPSLSEQLKQAGDDVPASVANARAAIADVAQDLQQRSAGA